MTTPTIKTKRKIWVVYQNPTDFPGCLFVMREHHLVDGKVVPGLKTWKGENLTDVRRYIPKGKMKMERAAGDEPQIVEWWY